MKKILSIFIILLSLGVIIGLMVPFNMFYGEKDVFIITNFEEIPKFNPYGDNPLSEKQKMAIEIAISNENVSKYLNEYKLLPGTLLIKEDFEKYGPDYKGILLLKNKEIVYVLVDTTYSNVVDIKKYSLDEFMAKTAVIEQNGGYLEIKVTGFTEDELNSVEEVLQNDPRTKGLLKGKNYTLVIQDIVYINDQKLQNVSQAMVILDIENGQRYVVLIDLTEKKVFRIGKPMNRKFGNNHESKS
ncbi:conserved hypothetical protein [Methanococcus vannielii SB]|uniref:PepSY domain-containing protein n=1 Tax=Methanococcus vannielii (strain ATCC 35089 / DSM 1224 / JCM 13029 / OCM 148 / SB) TaxID=406327 RepID=A6USV0_METVS|nr:hypothetical protein [Methanococcus vannielii]ABR55572.1 conserved hypothetical protein [Methanococcus vannielii SB]